MTMVLRPVLMPVPGGETLPRAERMAAQRQVSRRAVDESARMCGLAVRDWPLDNRGAPTPSEGVYWSVSHKPAWAAGVVSDGPVGIDVEKIAPRGSDHLFDRLAGDREWRIAGDRSWHSFFRLWTAKEAALKANGVGIAGLRDCRLVRVNDATHLTVTYRGSEWAVEHFYHDDHLAAVTANAGQVVWSVLENTG